MQIVRDGKYLALAFDGLKIFQIRNALGEAGAFVALADWLDENEPKTPHAVEHVCGISGYDGMKDPPCPGCDSTFRERADRLAHGKLVHVVEETGERFPPPDITDTLLFAQAASEARDERFRKSMATVNEKYGDALAKLAATPITPEQREAQREGMLNYTPGPRQARMIPTKISDDVTHYHFDKTLTVNSGEELRVDFANQTAEIMPAPSDGPKRSEPWIPTQGDLNSIGYKMPYTVMTPEEKAATIADLLGPAAEFYNTQLGVPYTPGAHPDSEKPLDLTGTKSSSEWADLCGIVIYDADGYRDGVMISDHITWDDFKRRVLQCTIKFPKNPNQYYEALKK